jgi:hypothetical protein
MRKENELLKSHLEQQKIMFKSNQKNVAGNRTYASPMDPNEKSKSSAAASNPY